MAGNVITLNKRQFRGLSNVSVNQLERKLQMLLKGVEEVEYRRGE
jgi:hypothetical protein